MSKKIMFVDPGLSGTGIAVWDRDDFNKACMLGLFVAPLYTHSFTRKSFDEYIFLFRKLLEDYEVVEVFCENAAYQGTGSVKGQMAASKGDLVKLAQLIGGYQAVSSLEGIAFSLVPVVEWKGQLPKDVVKRRITKVWPTVSCTNHDWDAVGIGMWAMGVINK